MSLRSCEDVGAPRAPSGPNDTDRARFGFNQKRLSQVQNQHRARRKSQEADEAAFFLEPRASEVPAGSPEVRRKLSRPCEPEEERPVVSPLSLSAGEETPSVTSSVEIVSLLQSALGDPDEALPLLRAKSCVSKFDFKGRIAELTEQNRQLRAAVASMREGHRFLAEALRQVQSDVNWKLRSVKGEVQTARAQIDDRGRMAEMLQEAVRAVWHEQAALASESSRILESFGGGAASEAQRNPELQEQVAALKQCCAAEAARAALAEALAREREQELAAMKAELFDQCESSKAAHEKAAKATQLVKEAGALFVKQEEELRRQHQDEKAALSAQVARAQSRIQTLETKLKGGERAGSTLAGALSTLPSPCRGGA